MQASFKENLPVVSQSFTPWDDSPKELLVNIFFHCDLQTLAGPLRLISKHWKQIATDLFKEKKINLAQLFWSTLQETKSFVFRPFPSSSLPVRLFLSGFSEFKALSEQKMCKVGFKWVNTNEEKLIFSLSLDPPISKTSEILSQEILPKPCSEGEKVFSLSDQLSLKAQKEKLLVLNENSQTVYSLPFKEKIKCVAFKHGVLAVATEEEKIYISLFKKNSLSSLTFYRDYPQHGPIYQLAFSESLILMVATTIGKLWCTVPGELQLH